MGRDIQAIKISGEDRRRYRDKVRRSLDAFARMLRERLFDENPNTVGQEIELNLTDEHGMPSMRNAAALEAIASPAWDTEVGQFNLEINVPPRMLDGDALDTLETELRADLNAADARARTTGSHLVMVGILPSLQKQDVHEGTLSANARYRVLNEQIFAARGEDIGSTNFASAVFMMRDENGEMLDAAASAGVTHLVGHEFRWASDRATVGRAIRAGAIGTPRLVSLVQFVPLVPGSDARTPPWWFDTERGGGWLQS